MRSAISSAILIGVCILAISCASKKYEDRLTGIQKQISNLTESYDKLSMRIGEIQDSLLVVQYQVDSAKGVSSAADNSKSSKKQSGKAKPQRATLEETVQKENVPAKANEIPDEKKEEVPVFELGKLSNDKMAGKPGDVFRLDDGKGFIVIEDESSKRSGKNKKEKSSEAVNGMPGSAKDFYQMGFSQYSKRKFNEAINTFEQFLKLFPEHDLSDNALYWIGESYVGKKEYALALPEFQKVAMEYPNGNKVPDAILMVGICHDNLNNKTGAIESWEKLVKLFPNTMAAKKARKKLDNVD